MTHTILIGLTICIISVFERPVSAWPNHKNSREDDVEVRIGKRHDVETGIMKRSIMIGSRVCGKGGLYSPNPVKGMEKRAAEIDLEQLHKDLHPDLQKLTTVIKDQPGATHVVSKTSNKPQWFERLNRCCIDHENCDKFIPAKEERYNYKNEREYTIYDCRCDDSFAQCLKYADSYTADAVGDLYFNVLKMPCINFQDEGETNATIDSQSIMDKVNAALKEKQQENSEESKLQSTKKNAEGNTSQENEFVNPNDVMEDRKQESVSLTTEKESSDAVEREARHFNRNGHGIA